MKTHEKKQRAMSEMSKTKWAHPQPSPQTEPRKSWLPKPPSLQDHIRDLHDAATRFEDRAKRAEAHAERLAEALKAMRLELKACARDCMTEAKSMRWIDDNEADIAAREALAQWEGAKQ
jgi:hypothetical protein